MTHDEANKQHWEPIFADAVRRVAPTNSQIYSKLILGLQAERDLFERKCEDMSAELATRKQRKMATKFMTNDFWIGFICGVIMFIYMMIVPLSYFVWRGWI